MSIKNILYRAIKILPIIPDNMITMRNIKKLLGQNIRKFRKAKNLTQEQLAELVGIGTANISYIENGKFSPSAETLEKLSEVLKVYPYEFYMFEHLKPAGEIKKELIEAINGDDDLMRLIYKFYRTLK